MGLLDRRRASALVALAGVVLTGSSCRDTSASVQDSPHQMRLVMSEYRIDQSGDAGRGRVVFEVLNEGRENHGITLYALPEDFPPINEQLQGETRRILNTTIASIYDFPPGRVDVFAADLTPGRYALVCFVRSPDGIAHSKKGMATEFRIK